MHGFRKNGWQWGVRTGVTTRGWRGLPVRAWRTLLFYVLWLPRQIEEITDLRREVSFLEARIDDLEADVEELDRGREELEWPFQGSLS